MKTIPQAGATERDISQAIRDIIEGRSNANGVVTLRTGQTTTIVVKPTINANAGVFLFPATATAATAVATTYANVVPGGGSFVISHASNAIADRTFHYLVNGG
jgi:hypothetical protein